MFDYNSFRRDTLDAVKHIGRALPSPNEAERMLSATQTKHRRGSNFVTDEKWQYRDLGNGALVVEISYGWMMGNPLIGLTVYCVGPLKADAREWDHSLSGCYHSIAEMVERLETLDTGSRERIAALVAAS